MVMSFFVVPVKGWCALRWPAPPHRGPVISRLSLSRPEWAHCAAVCLLLFCRLLHTPVKLCPRRLGCWDTPEPLHTRTYTPTPPHTHLKAVRYEQINARLHKLYAKTRMYIHEKCTTESYVNACRYSHTKTEIHWKHISAFAHAKVIFSMQAGPQNLERVKFHTWRGGGRQGHQRLAGVHTLAHGNTFQE